MQAVAGVSHLCGLHYLTLDASYRRPAILGSFPDLAYLKGRTKILKALCNLKPVCDLILHPSTPPS